ncbi:CPBP family intramembrane glutamic endopeptidase [uncultured Bacteroides sp.]|uniref:CPBP family intramembrane glutamic endopeptidase n=1 Tax=uncultured Bacteroides sp. TaxID=162156 RepID=UPI002AA65E22|nr:CPBP family intramembrane glutamic endopeptidase [uncultured Bacteroides sp.]
MKIPKTLILILWIIVGIGIFIYCVCEEFGWRGYLEEELKGTRAWLRILIISLLWYVWHLSFIGNPDFLDNLKFFCFLTLGSWGIGKVIELTKSIFAAACFHIIINIMMFNSLIKNGINLNTKLIILAVSVVIWMLIMKRWKKQQE